MKYRMVMVFPYLSISYVGYVKACFGREVLWQRSFSNIMGHSPLDIKYTWVSSWHCRLTICSKLIQFKPLWVWEQPQIPNTLQQIWVLMYKLHNKHANLHQVSLLIFFQKHYSSLGANGKEQNISHDKEDGTATQNGLCLGDAFMRHNLHMRVCTESIFEFELLYSLGLVYACLRVCPFRLRTHSFGTRSAWTQNDM